MKSESDYFSLSNVCAHAMFIDTGKTQGLSSSQIFGGAKNKIAKKRSIFFPIWARNNFELGKKKIFGGARGVAAVKFLVGQKKIAKKRSIFFFYFGKK